MASRTLIPRSATKHEPIGSRERASDNFRKNNAQRTNDTAQSYQSRINRIAERAHEIYEARGGQHGKALEDWLQAEREIDGESQ